MRDHSPSILSLAQLVRGALASLVATSRRTFPLSVIGIAIPLVAFDVFLGLGALATGRSLTAQVDNAALGFSYLEIFENLGSFANLFGAAALVFAAIAGPVYLRIVASLHAYHGAPRERLPSIWRIGFVATAFALTLSLAQISRLMSLVVIVTGVMIPTLMIVDGARPLRLIGRALGVRYVGPGWLERMQVFNQLMVTVCLLFLLIQGWTWSVGALSTQWPLIGSGSAPRGVGTALAFAVLADLVWIPVTLLAAAMTTIIYHQSHARLGPAPVSFPAVQPAELRVPNEAGQ